MQMCQQQSVVSHLSFIFFLCVSNFFSHIFTVDFESRNHDFFWFFKAQVECHLFWHLLSNVKPSGRFFQILRPSLNLLTLPFFFKFVSQANFSNIYPPTKWPRKQKISPWKVCGINYPQTLPLLSRRGPRSPDARLSQHYISPEMTFCHFFKFRQKKVFWLDNKVPAHFYTTLGVVICKNHVGRPLHSINKCRKFFL